MKCPGCSASVDDGTSICPKCDYIIDDSFLRSEPAPAAAGGETTNPGTPMPQPPPRRKSSAPRGGGGGPAGRGVNGVRSKRPATRKPSAAAAAPPPPAYESAPYPGSPGDPAYEPAPASYSSVFKPEESIEEAKLYVSSLAQADKLTLAAIALMAICSFFPWKETAAEGDLLGLEGLGSIAFGAMLLALGALVVRNRRRLMGQSLAIPWLIQLASIGFALVWCVVFIRLSWDPAQAPSIDGNIMVSVSSPSLGVFLGLLASLIGLGGTLRGMRDNPP